MFSGAVRAVFRKKKGFGFVKILHWLLLVLFSAAAALARLRLLAVGFDADGLPVPMDLNTMALPAVLIVAAWYGDGALMNRPQNDGIVLYLEHYDGFDRNKDIRPRSTNEQGYAQIIKDLEEAIPHLPAPAQQINVETRVSRANVATCSGVRPCGSRAVRSARAAARRCTAATSPRAAAACRPW